MNTRAVLVACTVASCGDGGLWSNLPVLYHTEVLNDLVVIDKFEKLVGADLFVYTKTRASAEIRIKRCGPEEFTGDTNHSFGHTQRVTNLGTIVEARICLRDPLGMSDGPLIIMHELTHALGHKRHTERGLMQNPTNKELSLRTLVGIDAGPWIRRNYMLEIDGEQSSALSAGEPLHLLQESLPDEAT